MSFSRPVKAVFLPVVWFVDVFYSFQGRLDVFQCLGRLINYFFLNFLTIGYGASVLPKPLDMLYIISLMLVWPINVHSLFVRRLHDLGVSGHEIWKIYFSYASRRGYDLLEGMFSTNYPVPNEYGERPHGLLDMTPRDQSRSP